MLSDSLFWAQLSPRPRSFLQFRRHGFRDNMLNAQEKSCRAALTTSASTWATLGSVIGHYCVTAVPRLCSIVRGAPIGGVLQASISCSESLGIFHDVQKKARKKQGTSTFCFRLVVSRGCFPCVNSGQSTQQVFCLIVRGAPIGVVLQASILFSGSPRILCHWKNALK